MKHFYFFTFAMIAMFSTQLLFAQTNNSSSNDQNSGLVAFRADVNNSANNLNNRSGLLSVNNTDASLNTGNEEYAKPSFQVDTENYGLNFKANFTAPKSGKAELIIKTISGQVIYKEDIGITKGSNSQLVNTLQLKNGIYLVSIINEQVNYNGKIQKM